MSKPRVFVTTDIGGGDNDDDQSMVHLLLYADKLDIEGLGSSAPGPGRASDIHQVIDAYARDFGTLRTHSGDYPTPEALRALVHEGALAHQPAAGFSQATAASNAIIASARAGSEADPLYVLTWGAIGDVAQALHDAPDIASKIRIISIGVDQQDPNAGRYMMQNWKGEVWWIDNQHSFRGMYAPENGLNEPMAGWVGPNAAGHGALGDYFVEHSKGLYWQSGTNSATLGIKMGDTPSLLYLLDQADNNNPTADSWGGDFVQAAPLYWTDNPSGSLAFGNYKGARTVAEDRGAFMADFAARLDRAKAPAAGSEPAPEASPSQPAPAPAPGPAPAPSGKGIGLGLTELDTLSLSGFTVETHSKASSGEWLRTGGNGSATGTFEGASGTYTLSVGFMDENDGSAPMSVSVNGQVVSSWTASDNNDQNQMQSVSVALAQGDTIAVNGSAHWGEYARMDWISISPSGSAPVATPAPIPTPAPLPAPVSSAGRIGLGVTELDTLSLSGFTVETHGRASSGEWVKTAGNGSATGRFEGTSGAYKLTVAYMDENDGSSPMSVSVNGKVVKSWVASANNDQTQTQSVSLSLNAGDTIGVNGTAHWGELARMDWLKLEAAGTAAPSTPTAPPPVVAPPSTGGSAAVPDSAFDLFAFAGQSNATGHFWVRSGDNSGGPLGESVFEGAVSRALGGPVDAINVGVSGSGSNQYADSSLYWWDINANKPSGLLVNAVNQILRAEAGGKQLDGLIWAQGEDDARQAYGGQRDITMARLTESTEKTFAFIRSQLGDPDLPIFLQELGHFPNDVPTAQYDAIRAAQAQIVARDPNTFLGATTTDLNRHNADNVHYSNAEYGVIAGRLASSVSQVIASQNAGGSSGAADTIVLRVSEDAWQGDARFTVKVDGAQVGGTQTATALRAAGQTQDIVLSGNWSDGRHKLSVEFLNDAWGGTAATDRNLHVNDIWINGQAQNNDQATLMNNGSAHFDVIFA